MVSRKQKEDATIFSSKCIVHEYIHMLLSLNVAKYKIHYDNGLCKSSVQSGLTISKSIASFDSTEVKKDSGFRDLDEAITEFLAIYAVIKHSYLLLNQTNLNHFLQASSYSEEVKKLYALFLKINSEKSFVRILLNCKIEGRIQPLKQFIKETKGQDISIVQFRNLDFN